MNISDLEASLARTLSFVERADGKANTQLAICGLLLTAIAATGIGNTDIDVYAKGLLILAIGFLAIAMVLDLYCVYPRLVPEKHAASRIYFDTAVTLDRLSPGIVKKFYETASEDDYKQELIGQIIENSKVAQKKFRTLNLSGKVLIAGSGCSAFYILARLI